MSAMLTPWLRPSGAAPSPWLVMCPFAGASAGAFRPWQSLNDAGIAISLAVYPGHDHRMREPPATSVEALADALAREIVRASDRCGAPLLLAGHSMGAQVAFETCRRLEADGVQPAGLVLSGCHAPHLHGRRRLAHLDDAAFVDALIDIGGCDAALRHDTALLGAFLPMLRADFAATERYHVARERAPCHTVRTATLLIHGTDDPEASRAEVEAWHHWLAVAPAYAALAGGHFYIPQRPSALLALLRQTFAATAFCP
ncbi:alpha/beta fold hydrolase [Cupriavidus sp. SZY C1]|uniref:thioesterase II family protein n=1 Tax=Cupriavidus sp. SZY C1 TaxID=3055037 RepID=UPI0028B51DB9|nr:alpha/beta fold hydrolase [Cupriavidus sp. SZY C1]MDT6964443.1 alpha/beta fold hydrolase [Cupriavidus sp. SZY C1]